MRCRMNLHLVRLEPDCKDRKCFERINDEAFPVSERQSMEEMFGLASDTDTEVLGIYDDGQPVGFTVLVKNAVCGYVYFLAIDAHFRSQGYGSAALRKLRDAYPGLQLILDFEEIDENAENYEQRVHRKDFYLRNGFYETGRYTLIYHDRFEVVSSFLPLCTEAFEELIHVLHAHAPKFMDMLA